MKTNELLPANGLTKVHWKPIRYPYETSPVTNDGPIFGELLRTHLIRHILIGLVVLLVLMLLSVSVLAQDNGGGRFLEPVPANYQVKQALAIESLFPMFFTGGYHVEPYQWIIGNDRRKWLSAVDPAPRETILSLGAFLQNLEYAASAADHGIGNHESGGGGGSYKAHESRAYTRL